MSGILLDHGKAGIIILFFCEVPLSWFGALAHCDPLDTYVSELVLGLEEGCHPSVQSGFSSELV